MRLSRFINQFYPIVFPKNLSCSVDSNVLLILVLFIRVIYPSNEGIKFMTRKANEGLEVKDV